MEDTSVGRMTEPDSTCDACDADNTTEARDTPRAKVTGVVAEPPTMSFAELVELFCLRLAEVRAILDEAGAEGIAACARQAGTDALSALAEGGRCSDAHGEARCDPGAHQRGP